jgi:uracil-DNA glycosylase family 4
MQQDVRDGTLEQVEARIIACTRCARLREYCARVAREKSPAHRDDVYWGRPVPGFGDPAARLLVLGLAPAAHGANRTGRPFTGDGPRGAGDFLMRAMHAAGFASLETARDPGDGLILTDAFLAAAVRCAPPGNTPTPEEIANCADHLDAEVAALSHLRVIVALGRIAFDAYGRLIARRGRALRPRPGFAHGLVLQPAGTFACVASYHPSRQNTNTGKLTAAMLADVFVTARKLVDQI